MERSRWEEAASEPQERGGQREREGEREISLWMRLFSHTDPTRLLSACILVRKPLRLDSYRFLRLSTVVVAHSLVATLKRVFRGHLLTAGFFFTHSAVRFIQLHTLNEETSRLSHRRAAETSPPTSAQRTAHGWHLYGLMRARSTLKKLQ